MAKAPAFQFYANDFVIGTQDFTAEQIGAYILLLCRQWDAGYLPNDEQKLCVIGKCTCNAYAAIMHKFSICTDGHLRNARLEEVRQKQQQYSLSRKENAKKRKYNENNRTILTNPSR